MCGLGFVLLGVKFDLIRQQALILFPAIGQYLDAIIETGVSAMLFKDPSLSAVGCWSANMSRSYTNVMPNSRSQIFFGFTRSPISLRGFEFSFNWKSDI